MATSLDAGSPLEPLIPRTGMKVSYGTQLIAGSNGNNTKDWVIRRRVSLEDTASTTAKWWALNVCKVTGLRYGLHHVRNYVAGYRFERYLNMIFNVPARKQAKWIVGQH